MKTTGNFFVKNQKSNHKSLTLIVEVVIFMVFLVLIVLNHFFELVS